MKKLFSRTSKIPSTNLIAALEAALPDVSDYQAEMAALDLKEARALQDMRSATSSTPGAVPGPEAQMLAARATAIVNQVRDRRETLEASIQDTWSDLDDLLEQAAKWWNGQVETRRQLARAALLNANAPFWNHDEHACAEALQGILTPEMGHMARAGWNGFSCGPQGFARTLSEAKCFLGHVKEYAGVCGIPLS